MKPNKSFTKETLEEINKNYKAFTKERWWECGWTFFILTLVVISLIVISLIVIGIKWWLAVIIGFIGGFVISFLALIAVNGLMEKIFTLRIARLIKSDLNKNKNIDAYSAFQNLLAKNSIYRDVVRLLNKQGFDFSDLIAEIEKTELKEKEKIKKDELFKKEQESRKKYERTVNLEIVESYSSFHNHILSTFGDLRIYGNECFDLRMKLIQSSNRQCLCCEEKVIINLNEIEGNIRENFITKKNFGVNTLVVFDTDWTAGSICKKCKELICGSCTTKALQSLEGVILNMPICPKCGKELYGIDHITD